MCDDFTNKDNEALLPAGRPLTRREFNKLGAGAALMMMLPAVANAQDVVEEEVSVSTPDGVADCYFVHPAAGAHAAVLLWPDILGLRMSFRAMGKRLAQSGYSVLVVNPFYRDARAPVMPEGSLFSDPVVRDHMRSLAANLSPQTCVSDGTAFIQWLDQQSSVDTSRKVGTMGYCMSGSYVMRLAAALPERVGAGGSFHGGGLVSDAPASPHLLIPQMQAASLLIAIAENDDEREPESKTVLREAFAAAGVNAEVEVYPALHGWCVPDSPAYHEAEANRAWARLLAIFSEALA